LKEEVLSFTIRTNNSPQRLKNLNETNASYGLAIFMLLYTNEMDFGDGT
jgi:hypothetical protein